MDDARYLVVRFVPDLTRGRDLQRLVVVGEWVLPVAEPLWVVEAAVLRSARLMR